MGLRFRILAAVYVVVVLAASDGSIGILTGATGVLASLGGLMILSVIALWPNSSRANRVDRRVDGSSWADRIDIDAVARHRPEPDA
ncbi:MAG: hypothetical protein K2Q28_13625 [Hyphomicrobium sp.]|nr:hypothetical protein [Hyphomicrobium sp.]